MIIKSPFKDYYDFVPTIYGVDEKIIYIRNKFDEEICRKFYPILNKSHQFGIPYVRGEFIIFKFLIFCGIRFLIEDGKFVINENEIIKNRRFVINKNEIIRRYQEPYLINLSKQLNAPVFEIEFTAKSYGDRYCGNANLNNNIPKLGMIGFDKLYTPMKAYSEIYFFMSNILRTNPDTVPPVEIDNKHKILAAGFDLKTSFRNPIK